MPRCAIILLAAGASTRLGSAKQLVEFDGKPLLVHAVQTALGTIGRPVVVVLGADADRFHPLIADLGVGIILNENWQRGMGTSIRVGMATLQAENVEAAMILLCDQPLITSGHLDAMIAAFFASGKSMAAARYSAALGTPAIFSKSHFAELLALGDNEGGKLLFKRYPNQVHPFDLPEAAVDLDTPADLQSMTRRGRG